MYHFPPIYVFIKIFMCMCVGEFMSSIMWVQTTAETRQGNWSYR